MKRTIKIIAISFAVIFCTLTLLSLFSGKIIKDAVLPKAEELLGVPISVRSASLNLLSGSFTAKELTVGNPEGFEEPHFITADKAAVDLSLLSLMRGKIVVSSSSLRNFTLHIIRNSEGDINASYFAARLQTEKAEETAEEPEEETATKTPPVKLSNLKAEIRTRYVDHAFTTNTLDYSFLTTFEVKDISNFGASDDYGTFSIKAHLENNPKVLSSALTGRVATLSDPLHPTFEIDGLVKSIHVPELDELSRKIGIYAKEFTIKTPFKSKKGRLRGDFTLTLTEPTPVGKLAKKLEKIQLPTVITATVPVRGTVEKPEIDWTGALLQTLLGNALGNIDAALKNIDLSEGGAEEQIENLVDSFKGIFEKKKKK
jgi:hypothetical protein